MYSDRLNRGSELYVVASLYMITFSIRLWNANKIKDPQLVLDVYDFGLESGVLLSTGKIPFVRFINLVTALGYIKTTDTTYEFVDKWVHLVDSESQEAIHALSYAHLKLIQGKYEELMPLLLGQRYETETGRMRSSSLELIGLYIERKNNYGLLANRLNNFKRVLKTFSSKKSNEAYRVYLNFTKVLDLLIKRDFIKLTIDIEKYSPITYKKWLLTEIKAGQK